MHNYSDVHKSLCPGNLYLQSIYDKTDTHGKGGPNGYYCGMMGWPAFVLPHLEGSSIHAQIDFSCASYTDHHGIDYTVEGGDLAHDIEDTCGDTINQVPSLSAPPVFRCPTAPHERPIGSQKDYGAASVDDPERSPSSRVLRWAVFYRNSAVTFDEIIDGTSNTFFVLEQSNKLLSRQEEVYSTASAGTSAGYGYFKSESVNPFLFVNHWSQGYACWTKNMHSDYPPNPVMQQINPTRHARSYHAGGLNGALGDGSVIFVSDTVDFNVWRAAFTRGDGESTSIRQ